MLKQKFKMLQMSSYLVRCRLQKVQSSSCTHRGSCFQGDVSTFSAGPEWGEARCQIQASYTHIVSSAVMYFKCVAWNNELALGEKGSDLTWMGLIHFCYSFTCCRSLFTLLSLNFILETQGENYCIRANTISWLLVVLTVILVLSFLKTIMIFFFMSVGASVTKISHESLSRF